MHDELLTVSAVAQRLKLPESIVRALERRRQLAAQRDSSGRRLFRRNDVEEFAKNREAPANREIQLMRCVRQ